MTGKKATPPAAIGKALVKPAPGKALLDRKAARQGTAAGGNTPVTAKAALTVVEVSGARVTPPDYLNKDELREWHEIVGSLPADYFRAADIPLLAAFCTASALYKDCRASLTLDGLVFVNNRGNAYKNPAADMLTTFSSSMAQLAVKLRLCPSARYSEKNADTLHKKATAPGKTKRPWEV